ncbi:MAG: hypothetical protein GF331_06790, partial [Chitinivibrionales bacterium]|nr:hypothetical protein [Chitinivibrionales bacterium]
MDRRAYSRHFQPGLITRLTPVFSSLLVAVLLVGEANAEGLFEVDVAREKKLIEGHIRELGDLLTVNKLQQSRATLRLIEDRLALVEKQLSRDERKAFGSKVDSLTNWMVAKEDSLVSVALDKLYKEGMDEALDYVQQTLRRMGLPQKRFEEIDRRFMEEAPKVQQKKEEEAMARAVKAIEQGRAVPDDVDPYIAMTAKRMVQARRDSVRAVQRAEQAQRREELEETRREQAEERARKAKQEEVERKSREEEQLRLDREEQRRVAEAEREREREMEEARRRDEAYRDSVAALEAQKQRLEQEVAAREAKRAQEEAELAELRRLEAERRAEKQAEERERLRKEREARERKMAQDAAEVQRLREEQERLAAQRAEMERIRAEEERKRRLEQEQREREERIEKQRIEEQRIAELEKFNKGETTFHETSMASGKSRSVREYMQQRQQEEKKAQGVVVQIYELLEKERPREAVELF